MELGQPGGESPRRDRAHPTAQGPGRAPPALPCPGSPCPPAAPGGGKVGGVMRGGGREREVSDSGRDLGSGSPRGLETLPEKAWSWASAEWG